MAKRFNDWFDNATFNKMKTITIQGEKYEILQEWYSMSGDREYQRLRRISDNKTIVITKGGEL